MFKALEIIDLADSSQVQLGLRSGDDRKTAPPVPFQLPLDTSDLQEIGWYFQQYLDDPFGPAKERAEAVETGLRSLGRLLFETVFGSNEEARALYSEALSSGLADCQLVLVSQRPQFLAIPWELLNEPQTGYLAAQLGATVRRSVAAPLPAFSQRLPTDQLNVLLASPQPQARETVQPDTLAPETVAALESLKVQVELDYLRPPTFAALAQRLKDKRRHYHIVHLDGLSWDSGGKGLVFESEDCGPDPVRLPQLAKALKDAAVPVVLLTASGSASLESWQEAAAGLSEGGVPLVVALPYPLQRSTAGEKFARQFYLALTQGTDVAAAVAQARRALMNEPHRLSPAGKLIYWDWITPTVYQSQDYCPAAIEEEQPDPLAPPVIQPQAEAEPEPALPRGGPYGLVGRQGELRQLERLLQNNPVVRLTGNTGVGKTELSLGLGLWCQKTGAMPGGVFYSTFEVSHPSSLERIIHEIGTTAAGLDFADMKAPQQRQWVLEHLKQHPSLVILDGLENISGPMGTGDDEAAGLLDHDEQADLKAFIAQVAQGGQSRLLLVSRRKEEPWLAGVDSAVIPLSGLRGRDRLELASLILDNAGVEPGGGNAGEDLLTLLELMEGHPLAMQIALPLLKEVPASVVTGEVQKPLSPENPAVPDEVGRDPYLTAAMEYSFSRMSRRHRTHLPFLSLFQRRVMMDILTHITQERVYKTVMGEELGWGACRTLLRSSLAAGFLEPISPSVYQIHPALPWFLGRKLHRQVSASGIRQLELEFLRVYADTADYFMESLYENQDAGATAVLAEEGNLTQALGLALEAQMWDEAQVLVQPLAQVYRMQKRYPELRRLRRQLLDAVGHTAAATESKGAIELWLYLLGTDANESVELLELERAEELNQQLLEWLEARPDSDADPRTAAVCHQFGIIALNRWRLDEAEGWLRRSLAIIENGEDKAAVADDYYAMGQVKQYQRLYTEAKDWYSKALDIHQRLPDEEEMVKDYRALGLVSQLKFEYQEAESWYHRAREMVEESRDEETAIKIFHELGTLCHAQYLFDDAESWYMQALTLSDRLHQERQMAVEMHYLGLLQQVRGILYEDAEGWFLAALERWERLGDRRSMGDECRQLGVLFHEQKRLDEAEAWYNRAREIFEEIRDIQRTARTYGQLGVIAEERGHTNDALEWATRTYQLAADHDLPVMPQVKGHLARLRERCGQDQFAQWWRGFTGGDPPDGLDEVGEDANP